MASRTIRLRTAERPGERYDVVIGRGLVAGALDGLVAKGQRVLLVRDSGVPAAAVGRLVAKLEKRGVVVTAMTIVASEGQKSLVTLERILVAAAEAGLERGDVMLAVGGGITTDVVGLAAGLHRRGCRVVHCPSTLLAMVDGSVGGKTGVNLEVPAGRGRGGKQGDKEGDQKRDLAEEPAGVLLKNAIGVFYQPARVVCDVALLGSLDGRTFRSGLAECIKHGLIGGAFGDESLLALTSQFVAGGVTAANRGLLALVARNVALKAVVVGQDERELRDDLPFGGRMALNLGHTFGHAIETLPGLRWRAEGRKSTGPLLHGEAVALGLVCATALSTRMGLCEPGYAEAASRLIAEAGLPVTVTGLPPAEEILKRMGADKKAKGGKLRLVLVNDDVEPVIATDVDREMIVQAIETIRAR